ncbi:MAG: class I SAM-dependent methyltransferase [Salegentibacter mishustinae]|nr:class I SAM-dependent methyltransferase [Salegentibacter mishustinae]
MYLKYFDKRSACPICHAKSFKSIYSIPYNSKAISRYLSQFYQPQGKIEFEFLNGVNYTLLKCEICKGIFQQYIPNDTLMYKLYEDWISPDIALKNHKIIQKKLFSTYYEEITKIQNGFYKNENEIKVLDYGMGWGTWAFIAQSYGWDTYGLELSPSRIKYAQSRGVQIVTGKEDLKETFDFINTEQVFEHIPKPLTTLMELKTWLKPNGIIKISVPTAQNIDERLKMMDWTVKKGTKFSLNPVAPLEHINFYRTESLEKMSLQTGLIMKNIPVSTQLRYTYWNGNLKCRIKKILQPFRVDYFKSINYVFLQKQE